MIFKTSLGTQTKIVTTLTTFLFVAILFFQYPIIKDKTVAVPILTAVLLLSIYFGTFIFRVTQYEITKVGIIIKRLVGDVKIGVSQIKSVERLNENHIGMTIRVFGNGGLWGYSGRFLNTPLGYHRRYTTRNNNLVLITKINGEKIILSPDEPNDFVDEIEKIK